MSKAKLQVAFLWHQHQPFYKNGRGYYQMPWVRFHGTKDYLDLLLIIKEFPEIRQNINLVPSLLLQLEDYLNNGARDNVMLLTEVPAADLNDEQKRALLHAFFQANPQTMIRPFPRYHELFQKSMQEAQLSEAGRLSAFSEQDFRDLQVWYNLVWMGPVSRERPALKELLERGKNFTEADKQVLMEETRQILAGIIPGHRAMWESGQIELSTSPYYHPILPLLIDTRVAAEANPAVQLPPQSFSFPEDAEVQLKNGLAYFERLFGRKPAGIWPSEGSVSEKTAHLLARQHLQWMATDEAILAATLGEDFQVNDIYQPHRLEIGGRSIHVFFRDHQLSDSIGFVYSNWSAERAVQDFVQRLLDIRRRLVSERGEAALKDHLVSVILDGENCWEHYPDNGRPFLRALFQALSSEQLLTTMTFSQFLAGAPQLPVLTRLAPGSWINGNFDIWIGSQEDNRAWELLTETRAHLVRKQEEGTLPEAVVAQAWEHIYIAEGSDWCWWYGDEHVSAQEMEFDELFREQLMKVYEITGSTVPPALYQSIKRAHFEKISALRPLNFIHPQIDGKVTHFYEWVGSAVYDSAAFGQSSMHQVSRIIEKLYLGFDAQHLYLRVDFAQPPSLMYEFVISAKTPRPMQVIFSPLRGVVETRVWVDEILESTVQEPLVAMDEILEAAITFEALGLKPHDVLGFQLLIQLNEQVLESFPNSKMIELEIPEEDYDLRQWSV